jgi:ABC-type sugar transport system substrate-binding protein
MKRRARFGLFLGLVIGICAVSLLAQTAGSAAPQKQLHVSVILVDFASPFWTPLKKGAQLAGKKYNAKIQLSGPIGSADPQQMISLFKNATTAGADAIVVYAPDKTSLKVPIQQAVKKGVFVVLYATSVPGSGAQALAGPDVTLEGRTQGARVLRTLHDEGFKGTAEAAITLCVPGAEPLVKRQAGFTQVVTKQNPYRKDFNVKIVTVLDSGAEPAKALNTWQNILTGHPKLKVFSPLCAVDTTAAATTAKKANRRDIVVAGYDWLPTNLDLIQQGWLDWALADTPYDYGYEMVKMAALVKRGFIEAPTKPFQLPFAFATKDNVDLVRKDPNAGG